MRENQTLYLAKERLVECGQISRCSLYQVESTAVVSFATRKRGTHSCMRVLLVEQPFGHRRCLPSTHDVVVVLLICYKPQGAREVV